MFSNHAKKVGATILVLAFVLTAPMAQAQSKSHDADEAAIRQSIVKFSDAFNHHDPQACAARYVEDGDFSGLSGQFSHGKKELLEHYSGVFGGYLKAVRSTFKVVRIRFLTPEIAGVDLTWSAEGTLAADGSVNPVRSGLIDLVMTKHGGQWLITLYHESMPPPSATK